MKLCLKYFYRRVNLCSIYDHYLSDNSRLRLPLREFYVAFFKPYLSCVYCCNLMCICLSHLCLLYLMCICCILCVFVVSYVYLLYSYVYLLYLCVFVVLMCICFTLMCICCILCVFVVLMCICCTLMCICCTLMCICCTYVYLLYSYVYLLYYMCIDILTLDAGLLDRSQYREGPATGHLDTGFSWFPCVYKRMLRWFPSFQVATTCFSCIPPDLNFLVTFFFISVYM